MKRRQYIISAIISAIILLAAAFGYQSLKANKQSTVSKEKPEVIIREVDVESFAPSTVSNEIVLDGRLNAFEKIMMSSEVTGRLMPTEKTYREGSYFNEGDLLFQVNSKDNLYNLYAQRSSLLNAVTQIMPDLKFDYPTSHQNWKNYLDAFDIEKSVKPLPSIQNEREKYFIAGKNIYNLYYSIKSLEDRMSDFNIYAPFSGVFLTVNAFPGSLVSPGTSLGQIMNTSRYELIAPIAMENLKYVSKGQRVKLTADDLGKTWNGTVNRISNQIDQATQSIPLYISVSGQGLKDGIFLKGTLKGKNISQATEIPRSVIIDQTYVWIFQDGKTAKKKLDIVSRVDQKLIVKGLEANDQVITSGVNNLYEGQEVVIRK